MLKDFAKWFKEKTKVNNEKARPFFHEGEVWSAALGTNVGFEQDGRGEQYLRPIIVTKKFNKEICWGIPLTKNHKKGQYYFAFILNDGTSTAILSQIRLVDAKRMYYRIGALNEKDFAEMKKRLKALLP